MNIVLLLKVADRIAKAPENFNMSYYFLKWWNPECGTVGCIAGWGVALALGSEQAFDQVEKNDNFGQFAQKVLGLTDNQRFELFSVYNWDEPYQSNYYRLNVNSIQEKANMAVEYIHYFIKKHNPDYKFNEELITCGDET